MEKSKPEICKCTIITKTYQYKRRKLVELQGEIDSLLSNYLKYDSQLVDLLKHRNFTTIKTQMSNIYSYYKLEGNEKEKEIINTINKEDRDVECTCQECDIHRFIVKPIVFCGCVKIKLMAEQN